MNKDEFTPYVMNRLIRSVNDIHIIIPNDHKIDTHALICPCCDYLFVDESDISSYEKFKCCNRCEINWAIPNLSKWKEGWRPNKEQMKKRLPKTIEISL